MNEEFPGAGKLDPIRMRHLSQRAYVKEADLQIHVPTTQEASQLDETYSFKNVLGRYLDDVNTLQHDADAQIQRLAAGETQDIHEVMLDLTQAEHSFDMMMEIRAKLLEAYQELMKMS